MNTFVGLEINMQIESTSDKPTEFDNEWVANVGQYSVTELLEFDEIEDDEEGSENLSDQQTLIESFLDYNESNESNKNLFDTKIIIRLFSVELESQKEIEALIFSIFYCYCLQIEALQYDIVSTECNAIYCDQGERTVDELVSDMFEGIQVNQCSFSDAQKEIEYVLFRDNFPTWSYYPDRILFRKIDDTEDEDFYDEDEIFDENDNTFRVRTSEEIANDLLNGNNEFDEDDEEEDY